MSDDQPFSMAIERARRLDEVMRAAERAAAAQRVLDTKLNEYHAWCQENCLTTRNKENSNG